MIDLFKLTQPLRDRTWFGYVFAVISVGVSIGIRFSLGAIATRFPFVIFLPPVILTTFLGGLRPGILAALAGGVIADVTMIAPPGALWPLWPVGWIAMIFYFLTVALDIAVIHAMTRAFNRAAEAERDLKSLNEDLEHRVADRTAALQRQILERRQAEDQVRQLQKMESVGQLTGGIAHDFNNMLAVVIGSLEMARRRRDEPARVDAFIVNAEEAARRAADLTGRLLAFSRQQPLSPQRVDANGLIEGMLELMRRTLGETVRVETRLAPDLWPSFADPGQVENAILNLVVNARDAMPDGGQVTIQTANEQLNERFVQTHSDVRPGPYVMISVSDTGSGIPPEQLERVFEPFFTTKEVGKGTGLGLSQVYGFVKQSGGHVGLSSKVGEGTTVQLFLPRLMGPTSSPEAPVSVGIPLARPGETILVVEDEVRVRQMSVEALGELGYTVVQAKSGEDALALLAGQPSVDLLFTDVVMPQMTGDQLADRARAHHPALRVIFVTGYIGDAEVHLGDGGGGAQLLQKPFTLSELAVKVRQALDG